MDTSDASQRIVDLRELPQSLEPRSDLWPGIRAATVGAGRDQVQAGRGAGFKYGVGLVAAAGLIGFGVLMGRSIRPEAVIPAHAPASPRALFMPGPRYVAERRQLLSALGERLAALPEPSRAKVAASLETLRAAIADIEAALGADPSNVLLQELLLNSYEDEMQVLVTLNEIGEKEI